jgi:magnesium chelatase family protein
LRVVHASVTSTALVGVEPTEVSVEAHVRRGEKEYFAVVGLPDTAVREARERVMSAIAASSYSTPKRVTVNLSPADIPKAGSAYDLPIALGVLAANGQIEPAATRVVALGELALDGSIRATRGGLGAALVAKRLNRPCLLPPESAREAAVVGDVDIRIVTSLAQAVSAALGSPEDHASVARVELTSSYVDLQVVRGQALAKRSLEIAAAGGHHLLMSGAPGVGKTLLARCLPGILPRLGEAEALEVAQIWSAAGVSRKGFDIAPFRSPHHTATVAALIGGGSGMPSPGEVTLAHRGVLFLDELGEFPPRLLESLRQPLEDGAVTIARRGISVTFPSSFQVVAATNPCPCGFWQDSIKSCTCTASRREGYRTRFSGPLLDRFDLRLRVRRVAVDELTSAGTEPSAQVAARVQAARGYQSERSGLNRELSPDQLNRLPMSMRARGLLAASAERSAVTARGWDRLRRVARTIADLAASESVEEEHMAEALALRGDV